LRTRWDEVEEIESGSHRFLGFSAITWAIAVPVAFIAGAAIMSYFDQSQQEATTLAIPAPSVSENAKAGTEGRVAAEKNRWEEQARDAVAKAAELQMQVEALRDQVSDEARRRQQAEQTAAQKTTELEQTQQAAASAERTRTSAAITPEVPAQRPLAYVEPVSAPTPTFGSQAEPVAQSGRANDDSVALQRIIEDTASRSAALSDRRDEADEATTSQTASVQSARSPRRDSDVETALGRATGLDGLSASQRSGLKTDLTAGACVAISLEKVLGNPVPVVPLRNLVRDLDSDC
jgi:hypothetical protein